MRYEADFVGEFPDKDYSLGLAIYEVPLSPMSYQAYSLEEMENAAKLYAALKESGYPYDYPWGGGYPQVLMSKDWKLVHLQRLNDEVYYAGTKKQSYSGTIKPDFEFQSHKAYIPKVVLMYGDQIVFVDGKGQPWPLTLAVYYCWPNDLNGNKYVSYADWSKNH